MGFVSNLATIVFCLLVLFFLVGFSQASAQTFRDQDFKLAYSPTICAIEPFESDIADTAKTLLDQTKYAVIDWQTKLREATPSRTAWSMNLITVPLNQQYKFDYNQCDVEMYYEPKPPEEDQFGILGLTTLDEKSLKPIITIYYLQIDPNLQVDTKREGNIIYYTYSHEPKYIDQLRSNDQLSSVIRHELGHSFGLGHFILDDLSEMDYWEGGRISPPSIMVPLSPEFTKSFAITTVDINKIVSIYGTKGFGEKPTQKIVPTLSTIELETYQDEKNQFSIGIPKGWETKKNTDVNDNLLVVKDRPEDNSLRLVIFQFERDDTVTGEKYLSQLETEEEKRCRDTKKDIDGYICTNFKVLDSNVIKINGRNAYQIKDGWLQDNKYSMVSLVTEIPEETKVWQVDADVNGFAYQDFSGKLDAITKSFSIEAPVTKESGGQIPDLNPVSNVQKVPTWVKNNAKWWSENSITDNEFVQGIGYLVNEGIIKVPYSQKVSTNSQQKVPDWIKNNAKWWSDDLISEDDFVKGIQYLVENGIIKV